MGILKDIRNSCLFLNNIWIYLKISHIEEILKEIGNDVEENNDKENEGEENWEDYETDSEDDINEMDQGWYIYILPNTLLITTFVINKWSPNPTTGTIFHLNDYDLKRNKIHGCQHYISFWTLCMRKL